MSQPITENAGQAGSTIQTSGGRERRLGPLSGVARRGKLKFFLGKLAKDARILDFGCADNWFKRAASAEGFTDVTGLDLQPPADVVGDIFRWRELGLEAHSFDAVIAFEVIEHGDFSGPLHELIRPSGLLMATTPVPRLDPVCKMMESVGLLQRRTSPHSNLTDLTSLPRFETVERHIKAGVSQWAVLRPLPDEL